MSQLDRISVDSQVRSGKPCVCRTRITVGEVLGFLASGRSEVELVLEFPQLTRVPTADLLRASVDMIDRFASDPEAAFPALGFASTVR